MSLPVEPPVVPMLAELQEFIPEGAGWLYEPKWDGFRAVVFRDGDNVHLGSRKQQPLERYFPELVETLKAGLPHRCVLDGEIIIPGPQGLDFEVLQQRIHPAASRVNKLSKETPASFVAFDLLALEDEDLRARPFAERRQRLKGAVRFGEFLLLTPQTESASTAARWFHEYEGAGMDGVIAKRAEQTYVPGERVMVKVKHRHTVDCVVGGYRMLAKGDGVGSLLLGLYDGQGVLHHVGHTSSFSAKEKRALVEQLKPLEGGQSFGQGRTPGAPSRWSSGKNLDWVALTPSLVCEVTFDYLQGDRFRHAATFVRWRTDKPGTDCTYAQLTRPAQFDLKQVMASTAEATHAP